MAFLAHNVRLYHLFIYIPLSVLIVSQPKVLDNHQTKLKNNTEIISRHYAFSLCHMFLVTPPATVLLRVIAYNIV